MAPSGAPAASASPIFEEDRARAAEPLGSLSTQRPRSGNVLRRVGRIRGARSHDRRLGGRSGAGARPQALDLGGQLLDALRQSADLVAGGNAEAVERAGEHLVDLLAPLLPLPLSLSLRLVELLP